MNTTFKTLYPERTSERAWVAPLVTSGVGPSIYPVAIQKLILSM